MRLLICFCVSFSFLYAGGGADKKKKEAHRKAILKKLKNTKTFKWSPFLPAMSVEIPDSLVKLSLKRNDLQLDRLEFIADEGHLKKDIMARRLIKEIKKFHSPLAQSHKKLNEAATKAGDRLARNKDKLRKQADKLYERMDNMDDPPENLVKQAKEVSAQADAMLKVKVGFTQNFPENSSRYPIDKEPL